MQNYPYLLLNNLLCENSDAANKIISDKEKLINQYKERINEIDNNIKAHEDIIEKINSTLNDNRKTLNSINRPSSNWKRNAGIGLAGVGVTALGLYSAKKLRDKSNK